MSGIQTQPRSVVRDLRGQQFDFISELNTTSGVRVYHRSYPIFLPGNLANGNNVADHPVPIGCIQPRCLH
ncbi:hypothetical protein D3C71_1827690 [compost metagenome]